MKKIIVIVSLVILTSFSTKEAKAQLGYDEGYNAGFAACTNSLVNIIQENPQWSIMLTAAYYVRSGTSIWNTTDIYSFYNTSPEDRYLGYVTTESGVFAGQMAVSSMLGSGTYAQIQGYQFSNSDFERGVYAGYNAAMVAMIVQL